MTQQSKTQNQLSQILSSTDDDCSWLKYTTKMVQPLNIDSDAVLTSIHNVGIEEFDCFDANNGDYFCSETVTDKIIPKFSSELFNLIRFDLDLDINLDNKVYTIRRDKEDIYNTSKNKQTNTSEYSKVNVRIQSRRIKIPTNTSSLQYINESSLYRYISIQKKLKANQLHSYTDEVLNMERDCGFRRFYLNKNNINLFQKEKYVVEITNKTKFITAKIKFNL